MVTRDYPPLAGWLTAGGRSRPVQVRFASRFSLWAISDEGDGSRAFENLDVSVGDQMVRVGPCRTVTEPDDERVLWLIPTRIVHELEPLFTVGRPEFVAVELSVFSVSSAHRQGIEDAFRNSLSDLTYGLNDYQCHLDQLDTLWRDEIPAIRDAAQADLISRAAPGFGLTLDQWSRELLEFSAGLSPSEQERYGSYFRRHLAGLLVPPPSLDESVLSTFDRLLQGYLAGLPRSSDIRATRPTFSSHLFELLRGHFGPQAGPWRILSITGGGAFEWEEPRDSPLLAQRLELSLGEVDGNAPTQVRPHLALKALDPGQPPYDLIASPSILDALTDEAARTLIGQLYRLLIPGGSLVLGSRTAGPQERLLAGFWCGDHAIFRTGREILALVGTLPGAEAELSRDNSGVQTRLKVTKKPADREPAGSP